MGTNEAFQIKLCAMQENNKRKQNSPADFVLFLAYYYYYYYYVVIKLRMKLELGHFLNYSLEKLFCAGLSFKVTF